MSVHPIIAALRKHKAGTILIAAQIALTLAIVCNAVFIIGQRIERVHRPTGIEENDLFLIQQQWVGAPSGDDPAGAEKLDAKLREDLAALAALPDVAAVTPINSLPLLNSSWNGAVALKPGHGDFDGKARTTYYFADERLMATLGLKLVAGRAFDAGDVQHRAFRDQSVAPVAMLTKGAVDRIVLSRPAVEAGERLGFLPGDLREKVDPYLRPLYDALYDMLPAEQVVKRMSSGDIEIAPLAFMRGRTLAHSFVILDEAQNTTPMQMKMFLTRLGESSRMVVTGDLSQIDLPSGTKSGLKDALEAVAEVPDIGVTQFTEVDVVRHHLVAKIVQAYDKRDRQAKKSVAPDRNSSS